MRTHTQEFKEKIKEFGREFDDTLYYSANGVTTTYDGDHLSNVNYSYDTSLLKSVMQTLTFDSDLDLEVGNLVSYGCSLVGVQDSEIRYNNFIITKKEEQKDTNNYKYTCYDNMIKSMTDYVSLNVTYPITIRSYLSAICTQLGITFGSSSDTFANYDEEITSEHYLDSDGNSLGYTFRDVLDDIAEAVGGFICINNNGELIVRYPTEATEEIVGEDSVIVGDDYEFTREITNNHQYVICNTNSQTANTINSEVGNTVLNSGTPTDNVWVIAESGSGYTIQNKVTSKYLGYVMADQVNVTLGCYDDPTVWTWNSGNGRLSFTTTGLYVRTWYLRYASSRWQLSTSSGSLYLVDLGGGTTTQTDTIDEEYFQDNNVNIGKKYGPINVVVLSRNDADNLYYPSTLPQNPVEIKINNNPILEQTNREDFIQGIYNQLNGLEFYLNDFQTLGVMYYEVGDIYDVSIGENTYQCLMLNDNIIRESGLTENIYTEEPTTSVTDYKYASDTDKLEKTSRNAYFLADKANGVAEMIVEGIGDNGQVTGASVIASINDDESNLTLNADKINLNGAVTANNNFVINQNGSVEINNGSIELYDDGTDTIHPKISITEEDTNGQDVISLFSYGMQVSGVARDNSRVQGGINTTGSSSGRYDSNYNLKSRTGYSCDWGFYSETDDVNTGNTLKRVELGAVIGLNPDGTPTDEAFRIINSQNSSPYTFIITNVTLDGTNSNYMLMEGNATITGNATIGGKLTIPKDSTKGIFDSDNNPILYTLSNDNAVLNASDGTLFLGYQNTTSLNILNGKANVTTNGAFQTKSAEAFKIIDNQSISTDATNSFQTTIFGVNNSYSKLKPIRPSNATGATTFSTGAYAPTLVMATGDTHMFISAGYNNDKVVIGAGNADKILWKHQVAWSNQLPSVTTGTGTATKSSGNGTMTAVSYSKYGNMVTLTLTFNNSGSATSAGSNIWVGTISGVSLPKTYGSGCGYFSTSGYMAELDSSGNLTIRVIGGQSAASNTNARRVTMTYVCA